MSEDSILELARELVRIPSRAGEDPPEAIITATRAWLEANGVPTTVLQTDGGPAGVLSTVEGAQPGATYCLNACLDTAPFGDPDAWHQPPTSAQVDDGRLFGRGAADSKVAVAIFAHLAAELRGQADSVRGRLMVLLDCDEHTGGFAGAKKFLASHPDIAGAMIGYPGAKEVVIGARGFYRATITVYGDGGHSGAKRSSAQNAIEKAACLVDALRSTEIPDGTETFPIGPALSVTGIRGGGSFSIVPDTCELMIDARLTPTFTANSVRELLRQTIADIDHELPGRAMARWEEHDSWPAYRLNDESPVANALLRAARRHYGSSLRADVCGPSNIGNLFAAHGVEATCGFGVGYRNLHAPNESADIADIPSVYLVYRQAIRSLLLT